MAPACLATKDALGLKGHFLHHRSGGKSWKLKHNMRSPVHRERQNLGNLSCIARYF